MFTLPDLPYDKNALEPAVSARTLDFHHDKHHAAYIKKTNALAKEHGLEGALLEEVVRRAENAKPKTLFHNAAQTWNHAFFWECMAPHAAQREAEGALNAAIARGFGNAARFREAFVKQGEAHFASGWIWLVAQADGAAALLTTRNAKTPITDPNLRPLFVCDLWEHAYYLDRQNDRKAYLEGWIEHLCNWQFAERQFDAALKGEEGSAPPRLQAKIAT